MTIEVEIKGTNQVVEFPDGTPPEVIQQALANFQSTQPPQQQQADRGLLQTAVGLGEAGLSLATGIVAEPVAGLVGGIAALNPLLEPGEGARAVDKARKQFTFIPRTEAGKEFIGDVGEFVQPAAELFKEAEDVLGGTTLEATGSPFLATIAATIPTALLELTGAAAAKGIAKLKTGEDLNKVIKEATPSPEELKDASRAVFDQIDALGATVKPEAFATLVSSIEAAAKEVGGSKRTTPNAFGVIEDFQEVLESGAVVNLDELNQLRTVANNAAKSIDPAQKAPALAIIDEIDTFLDGVGSDVFNKPAGLPDIGAEYRAARQIWGRARRAELLEEAFEAAPKAASGGENGLRIEFGKILRNKRQRKFFTKGELAAMSDVREGTTGSNLAKAIGRLGFSEGQSTTMLNSLAGAGAGGLVLGAPGAIAVPIIGQVSKLLAKRLTVNNAKFADQVVRAGSNAEWIAKAYVRNTPAGKRSAKELSELFIRNDVDLSTVKTALAKDAADIAKENRAALAAAPVAGSLRPEEEQ